MSLIIPANTLASGGFSVANSLRFNGSNDSLVRTPSSSGSTTINTWSFWVKRSDLDDYETLYSSEVSSTNVFKIGFTLNTLEILFYVAPSYRFQIKTNRLFRDVSASYNIVIIQNAGASTNTDRLQIWVNGVRETSFAITNFPDADEGAAPINASGVSQNIGTTGTENFGGYMSEVVHIDGTAYAASDFGEFDEDSGIWKPIDVSGLTFGTNGSYFQFKETGTSQNSSGMGADTSGEDNHYAVNNLTAIDQSTDTCTNNSCVINSLDNYFYASTLSEGNLKQTCNSGNYSFNTSTFGLSQGKWYVEVKVSGSNMRNAIGITDKVSTGTTNALETLPNGWSYQQGEVYNNSSVVANLGTFSSGNIVGIYLDLDNNKLYFAINGTIQNSGTGLSITAPASTTNGNYFFAFGDNASSNSDVNEVNFGSPSFAISSGNTDVNEYGNFEYDPSSGTFDGASKDFLSLCTANLSEVLG